MKFKQMKIENQLRMLSTVLIMVFVLMSLITIWQSSQLFQQTEILYNHPLQVRRALDSIKVNQQEMSVLLRDMILTEEEGDCSIAYERLVRLRTEISTHIEVLQTLYLGPIEDVNAIKLEFVLWEEVLFQNANLVLAGDVSSARMSIQSGGEVEVHAKLVKETLDVMDSFAKEKADELYLTSTESRNRITATTIALAAALILVMFVFSKRITGNIQNPLQNLVQVVRDVEQGKISERSTIDDENEFGALAKGLNGMLDNIENSMKLNKKSASLSGIMLSDDEQNKFFTALLAGLLRITEGQLGGIYLLSEDEEAYELFVSIGMEKGMRTTFDRASLEGELGIAAESRDIQLLKDISEDTRFVFPTAAGTLVPKELITIPMFNQREVFAFLTLGSVTGFDALTLELLENEHTVMSTRIQGILDLQQIKVIKGKLENQNRELEAQKAELDALSSELGEQNRELEQQKRELSEANRLKTNFLSNMSHELRTPLNSVIALSGVLDRRLAGRVSEEESKYLEVIGRSGKNLLQMINEILDISRIESGREELELTQFDIQDVIHEILGMLNPIAEEKGIELKYQVIGSLKAIVSDEIKIHHILQNIISNAVKFTETGSVELIARIEQGGLELAISDTGIGIAKEHQEGIFEEFRQADSSTTRMYGGTGLGLAIAKRYAEFLGGHISLVSVLGEGARFTVYIPLDSYSEKQLEESKANRRRIVNFSAAVAPKMRKANDSKERRHLLIVEDSEPAVIQLQDAFREEGYRITVARDGFEAIQLIGQDRPDGIILDLMMPKVDGFEVLKTIREDATTVHIPVLVLSAKHISKEELSELTHNHVYQLIQKGNVNLDDLKQAVKSMLNSMNAIVVPPRPSLPKVMVKPVVLVVEDNPDNRMTARAVLEDMYTILEAETGEEGVRIANEKIPDLILMDNALPGMDGVEAFRMIRNNETLAHIPIIALTASAMVTDREIFLAYGFDGFVPKPIIEEELLKAIKGVLYGY